MAQSCREVASWTPAVANMLLSSYWKTGHWTSKKEMETIPLASERVNGLNPWMGRRRHFQCGHFTFLFCTLTLRSEIGNLFLYCLVIKWLWRNYYWHFGRTQVFLRDRLKRIHSYTLQTVLKFQCSLMAFIDTVTVEYDYSWCNTK
jgi:hypothetical protein